MKVKCDICKFKCDWETEHEAMTQHLWEEHTTRLER